MLKRTVANVRHSSLVSAEPFALVLPCSSIHASLLGLSTARHAVGARQVEGAQVKVNGKVSSLVTRPEAELDVVELVAAMSIDSPLMRALGHDEEPRAFTTCVVQAAEAPEERVARSRKLQVCQHVDDGREGEGAHVEVATNEVDVVLDHVGVQASKKRGRGIALFGYNVVDTNGAECDLWSA